MELKDIAQTRDYLELSLLIIERTPRVQTLIKRKKNGIEYKGEFIRVEKLQSPNGRKQSGFAIRIAKFSELVNDKNATFALHSNR